MKKIAVLASGTKTGGGSGFQELVKASKRGDLGAEVVCVLSNHANGGVHQHAKAQKIRFVYFEAPWTAKRCYELIGEDVDLVCMSGWLKLVKGLDSQRTINIHPGPLPDFGGPGMYGHHVHRAVLEAFKQGKITHSAVSMHFVTDAFDQGPVFHQAPVLIEDDDVVQTLANRVNAAEHIIQWQLTKRVLDGKIHWDGKDPSSLVTP